ncbi:MAG: DNA polymerase III subunit delta' [Coriobacteriales bacterium]|nr:DNA polymerase III subunit delta' [Coriobacteriales bacterium]
MRCVWDDIVGQARVADFLRTAVVTDRLAHALLFVGPPGAGKKTAAKALACAIFCDDDGCGACPVCYRVRHGGHPDVHIVEPEGTAGYMVEQVRDLTRDVHLAPAEGSIKVYIVESADLFNDSSANAFLKTLEEPPADVVFILLAHAFDSVLPTIVSRCQVVRFRRIPPSEATALLVQQTGTDEQRAGAALAAAGGVVARARDFLESSDRRAARDLILRTLTDLDVMDDLDVLEAAKSLLVAVRAPLDGVKAAHEAEIKEQADFLGKGALKSLEDRQRRELTAREREGVAEVLNVAESWLRDCLVLGQGVADLVVNTDVSDAMERVAAVITPPASAVALEAVNEARRRISYNVSPQLAIEAMLFDIREVLRCPR